MSIGNLQSAAVGTAARFNTGKPQLHLIPLDIIADALRDDTLFDEKRSRWVYLLSMLGAYQMREETLDEVLGAAVTILGHTEAWSSCAAVFDYGQRKYKSWNWSKGMPWSQVISSASRHLVFGILAGEENDPESGLPHHGHLMCNLVMLAWYERAYTEGDDRYMPPETAPDEKGL
jgi:hypothetical protein